MDYLSLFSEKLYRSLFVLLFSLLFVSVSFATLSGIYTINNTNPTGGTNFHSFADAVTALNTGITGPVTFNVSAGQTFAESSSLTVSATGTGTNTILFQKYGGGANPVINSTAGTAGNTDGIVIIAGGDYITIDGIDLKDVTPGGSNYIEWGYALLLKNGSAPFDGCQYVTIKNCKITLLQSSLPNTFTDTKGIYVGNHEPGNPAGTSRTITAATDAANSCKFYNNTIDKCYYGIYVNGYNSSTPPNLLYDQNNEIGGSPGTGNTINNIGAGASTCAGIFAQYQNNLKINYNSITGGAGTTVAFNGISSLNGNNSNVDIIGNTVQVAGDAVSGYHYGIYNTIGNNGLSNTVNIQNNEVKGFAFNDNSSTGSFYGIYQNSSAYIVNVNGNLVHDCTIDVTGGSGQFYGINTTAGLSISTHNISGNQVYNLTKKNCPSAQITGIYYSYGSISIHDNIVHDLLVQNTTSASAEQIMGINNSSTFSSETNYNNTVYNLSYDATNSNDISNVYGIYLSVSGSQGVRTINNNTVYNLYNLTASVTGTSSVYGIYMNGGNSGSLYKCNIYGLTCNHGNAGVYGLYFGPGSASYSYNIYNNFVSDLNAPNSTSASALVGMCFAGGANLGTVVPTVNAYYNTVFINGSTGAGAMTYAAYINPASGQNNFLLLNNNIFVNTAATSGGFTIALGKASSVGSYYMAASNNNCYYAGTPGANNLIFSDGTSCQTVAQLKSYLDPRDLNSISIMPAFVNSTVKPYDLHINTGTASQLESGGQPVNSPITITTDYDNQTRSAAFPDIGADEFSGTKVDNTPPLISFTPLGNAGSGSARTLTVNIKDPSGVPTSGAGLPVLYWKKNAGVYSPVTAVSLGSNNYSFSFGAGTVAADVVSYYIVTQDQSGTPNVGCYPFKGASGFTVSPPAVSTPPTTPLSYTVKAGISGTVTVGSGGSYATLSALFTAINNGVVNGNINAQIISNITSGETGVKLNQWTEDPPNSNYSLTIRPDAEVMRTISGGIVYNTSGSGLVNLNGAKNVFIIGDIASPVTPGIYLTFRNTTTGGLNPSGNTFYLANGSTCSISYCDIQNNFFDAGTTGGNDIGVGDGTNTVTVNNCKIHDAVADNVGIVKWGIYCSSSSVLHVSNNNIYNCGVGIYLDAAASGGSITGNSFYYNASSTATGSLPQAALWTGGNGLSGVGGWNISNNYIGGSAPLCGGTPWTNLNSSITVGGTSFPGSFVGIGFRGNSTTLSLIQNNIIQNISFSYGDMNCIRFSGYMNISGNTIGDPAGTTKLICGTGNPRGIYGEAQFNSSLISTIENNTISNFYVCNVAAAGSASMFGMRLEQACNVRKNKIWGLGFQSVGGSSAPASFGLYGIYYGTFQSNATDFEISNNMISLNAVGIISPAIYGIYDANTYSPVQINYFYNTVLLYGSSNGSSNTFAFNRTSANIMTLKDNLLINNRTEAGSGSHFAISSLSLIGNSLISDYNDLYSVVSANLGSYPGTSAPVTFANWKSGISGDAHSSNVNITTTSSTDLHLAASSVSDASLKGTPIGGITTDIDGNSRNITSPHMGADEPPAISLNLTALIDGFYNGAFMISDTVTVELHSSSSPFALVDNAKILLNTSGSGSGTFSWGAQGTPYYLAVKHRNAVETWSGAANTFTGSPLNYNFTSGAAQAFGSNQVLRGSKWCLLSGDANQDGIVDSGDLAAVDNDNSLYVSGYTGTDVNGDGIVDSGDLAVVDNSNSLYVGKIVPSGPLSVIRKFKPVKGNLGK
jgi:hypothetical protein